MSKTGRVSVEFDGQTFEATNVEVHGSPAAPKAVLKPIKELEITGTGNWSPMSKLTLIPFLAEMGALPPIDED